MKATVLKSFGSLSTFLVPSGSSANVTADDLLISVETSGSKEIDSPVDAHTIVLSMDYATLESITSGMICEVVVTGPNTRTIRIMEGVEFPSVRNGEHLLKLLQLGLSKLQDTRTHQDVLKTSDLKSIESKLMEIIPQEIVASSRILKTRETNVSRNGRSVYSNSNIKRLSNFRPRNRRR